MDAMKWDRAAAKMSDPSTVAAGLGLWAASSAYIYNSGLLDDENETAEVQ